MRWWPPVTRQRLPRAVMAVQRGPGGSGSSAVGGSDDGGGGTGRFVVPCSESRLELLHLEQAPRLPLSVKRQQVAGVERQPHLVQDVVRHWPRRPRPASHQTPIRLVLPGWQRTRRTTDPAAPSAITAGGRAQLLWRHSSCAVVCRKASVAWVEFWIDFPRLDFRRKWKVETY